MTSRFVYIFAAVCLVCVPTLHSQDATQAPAGGIISLDDAPLTVAREHIAISQGRVFANYAFRNDTPQTITTTFAFVVPEYTLEFDRDEQGKQAFDDATFAIDGEPTQFDSEVRARLHGKDVTAELQQYHVDVASFGHFGQKQSDVTNLSSGQISRLVAMGLYVRAARIDHEPLPRWSVVKRYLRQQVISPGATVRVQLTYAPVPGAVNSIRFEAERPDHPVPAGSFSVDAANEMHRVCASPALQQRLQHYLAMPPHNVGLTYVDYSLTGEHAWKGPVEDFELQIESPASVPGNNYVSSVCWSGSDPEVTKTEWTGHAKNYVPGQNLRVGWFQLEHSEF
jgi:hypothetical protein